MSNPLRRVDLNLLPILDALLTTGSVSLAAVRVGLSQPATSQALGRLRHLLEDPLLVRNGQSMRLTARALDLRQPVAAACQGILGFLSPQSFEPERLQRTFTIATPDYCAFLLSRMLLPEMASLAPGVDLRFVDASAATLSQLVSGKVDLALTARLPFYDAVRTSGNFSENYVCLVGPGHPLASRKSVPFDEIEMYPRAGINHSYDSLPFGPRMPKEAWFKMAPSHLLVLSLLVAELSSIAVVTRALARLACELSPASVLEIEDTVPPLKVCMAWSPAADADKPHQWFRQRVMEAAAQIFAD
ncbi:MAG: hypothetical protein RL481_121 [Pseudomonadota bacterium]|jgi:DNA-binding transcriptional LysR family regulator